MKRRILAFSAAVICALSIVSLPATAQAMDRGMLYTESDEGGPVAHTERVKWYYRTNNGVLEKRLWSITYGHWITAWVPA